MSKFYASLPVQAEEKTIRKHVYYVLTGGFLESFDLLLYLHFAYIIDKAFLPVEDEFLKKILLVFSFSSVLILQPFGAWFWGIIGDRRGRKSCVVITAALMGFSSLIFPLIPSYNQSGIGGFIIVLGLRALQGFACIGDSMAVNVYITESVKAKSAGFWVSMACVVEGLAEMCALGLGHICLWLSPENGWRYPFMIGGGVVFFSIFLRKRIAESRAFLTIENLKRNLTSPDVGAYQIYSQFKGHFWRFAGIETLFGFGFFFVYLFCSDLLRTECNMPDQKILIQSLLVSACQTFAVLVYGLMSFKIDSLKIVRYRACTFILLLPVCFYILSIKPYTPEQIFCVQVFIAVMGMDHIPCLPVLIRTMPVRVRMRLFGLAFSIGKTSMYILTSFGIVFIIRYLGVWGVFAFYLLIALLFAYCIWTFKPIKSCSDCSEEEDGWVSVSSSQLSVKG